ncbi:MAG TPA: beta-ketoacyl synthase N-terminal-like domain-containing protein [archaeon]|nr:beta-ketoacyl synthase N-terminal-like domain-containing protein [archaeon]
MTLPVRLSGIGISSSTDKGPRVVGAGSRLATALSVLPQGGSPVRLFHPIEEMALLAAYDALSVAGVPLPVGGDGIGIALGVDEGIDGIKARYYQGVLSDGPLGASPMAFPFTTPNTIAARISILLDLRGESLTVCGGNLSGAQAIGLAMETLREGRSDGVLAGGATSVEQEFLDALCHVRRPDGGQPRGGACLLFLEPQVSAGKADGMAALIGYAEGFGKDDIRDAIQCCLEDASLFPEQIGSVRVASVRDSCLLSEALRQVGVNTPIVRSPASNLYSTSFPAAVAEAVAPSANGTPGAILVVGTDCLAGASAALIQVGGRQ